MPPNRKLMNKLKEQRKGWLMNTTIQLQGCKAGYGYFIRVRFYQRVGSGSSFSLNIKIKHPFKNLNLIVIKHLRYPHFIFSVII